MTIIKLIITHISVFLHLQCTGDKYRAAALSKEGHEINLRMKNAHWLAATSIFQSRNSESKLRSGVVDLHGLHAVGKSKFLHTVGWCSSTILYNIISIAYNHHTDIYPILNI